MANRMMMYNLLKRRFILSLMIKSEVFTEEKERKTSINQSLFNYVSINNLGDLIYFIL